MREIHNVDISREVCKLLTDCRQLEARVILLQGDCSRVTDYTSIQQPHRDIHSLELAQEHLSVAISRLERML